MTDDQKIGRMAQILFDGDPIKLQKSLWRVSGGNKDRAFDIANNYLKCYNININVLEFDIVCSMMSDNVEVEWDS